MEFLPLQYVWQIYIFHVHLGPQQNATDHCRFKLADQSKHPITFIYTWHSWNAGAKWNTTGAFQASHRIKIKSDESLFSKRSIRSKATKAKPIDPTVFRSKHGCSRTIYKQEQNIFYTQHTCARRLYPQSVLSDLGQNLKSDTVPISYMDSPGTIHTLIMMYHSTRERSKGNNTSQPYLLYTSCGSR